MECIEEGIVTRTLGADAEVTTTRAEACSNCESRSTCSALGGNTSSNVVRVANPIGAVVGDRVAVTLPGSSIVGAAGLLYFFPAVALIAGAFGGNWLATTWGHDPNVGTGIGALAMLLSSFASVAFVGRKLGKKRSFVPQISRVILEGEIEAPSDVERRT